MFYWFRITRITVLSSNSTRFSGLLAGVAIVFLHEGYTGVRCFGSTLIQHYKDTCL